MAHEIGQEIAGDPMESRVSQFKEFLSRPENLATALVLAASLTGEKRQGQSGLNKALESGVGALGFRGGIEQGVTKQRRQVEQDTQAAAKQAGELALGGRQVGAAETRNKISREQLTTPRPLPASEIALNEAQAAALGRTPPDKNATPTDFAGLFAQNKELALTNLLPNETLDENAITRDTLEQLQKIELAGFGALVVDENGIVVVDTDRIPADRLNDFKQFIPEGTPDAVDKPPVITPATPESILQEVSKPLDFGRGSLSGGKSLANLLRQGSSEFGALPLEVATQELAAVVKQIRAGDFDTASAAEIQSTLDRFRSGLPQKDLRLLRTLLRRKLPQGGRFGLGSN